MGEMTRTVYRLRLFGVVVAQMASVGGSWMNCQCESGMSVLSVQKLTPASRGCFVMLDGGGCARRLMRNFCRNRWFCHGEAVGALFWGRSVRGQIAVACGAVAVMELAVSLLRMRRVGGRRDAGTLSVMSAGRACFYMRVGGRAAAEGAPAVMAQSSPNQSTMVVDWPGPRKIEFLHLTHRDTS